MEDQNQNNTTSQDNQLVPPSVPVDNPTPTNSDDPAPVAPSGDDQGSGPMTVPQAPEPQVPPSEPPVPPAEPESPPADAPPTEPGSPSPESDPPQPGMPS